MLCILVHRIRMLEEVLAIFSQLFAYQGENPENSWLRVRIIVIKVRIKMMMIFLLLHIVSPGFDGFISIHLAHTYWASDVKHCARSWQYSGPLHTAFGVEGENATRKLAMTIQSARGGLGANGTIEMGCIFSHRQPPSNSSLRHQAVWQRWISLLVSMGNRTGFSWSTWFCKPLRPEIDFPGKGIVIGKHF